MLSYRRNDESQEWKIIIVIIICPLFFLACLRLYIHLLSGLVSSPAVCFREGGGASETHTGSPSFSLLYATCVVFVSVSLRIPYGTRCGTSTCTGAYRVVALNLTLTPFLSSLSPSLSVYLYIESSAASHLPFRYTCVVCAQYCHRPTDTFLPSSDCIIHLYIILSDEDEVLLCFVVTLSYSLLCCAAFLKNGKKTKKKRFTIQTRLFVRAYIHMCIFMFIFTYIYMKISNISPVKFAKLPRTIYIYTQLIL